MLPGPYDTVPLTDDERNELMEIYQTRLRFFFLAYTFLIGLAAFTIINPMVLGGYKFSFVEALGIIFIGEIIPILGLIITGIYVLFTRILPFRRDALSGIKEKVPYRVTRKEYDVTGQYYVALDDPDYMHHELDEETYNSVNEGDLIYVYRGVQSKFVFEPDGRYTL